MIVVLHYVSEGRHVLHYVSEGRQTRGFFFVICKMLIPNAMRVKMLVC